MFLQLILKHLPEFFHFRLNHIGAIALAGVAPVIILVIIFRCKKILYGFYGCYNRGTEGAAAIQLFFIIFGLFFLFIIMVKDYRTVLRAGIIPLAVHRGGVVCLTVHFQYFVGADHGRIVSKLAHFGMTGGFAAHFIV